ncbi:hypothetical protein PflQ2_1992 [Pseudomonas fluorescens Q2-87]|uniref:Uncharacterized protein n=1 Tax=Pseudomonas fluorescens (strain Q2-87) TaxID=1038922 RepID=J2MUR9_PSEFQ|nr:hypothetical protein PflQ2_1992 [Pseudomonas fluorescens Q2-87]
MVTDNTLISASSDQALILADVDFGRLGTGRFRPILLKKSAMVATAEKYAPEVEILTLGRGFQAQISRSSVQKRRFHRPIFRPFGRTDFFNRIGQ